MSNWNLENATGWMMALGLLTQFPGLMMFWIRGGQKGGKPRTRTHFLVERGLIMTSVVLIAIGFVLLQGLFQNDQGRILVTIGAAAYFFGAVMDVAGEALSLTIGYEKLYPAVVVFVVTAFVAQALVGVALLLSGIVAAWIGWASIMWNLVWLAVLPLLSPDDIYFPVLHTFTPLLLAVALLLM